MYDELTALRAFIGDLRVLHYRKARIFIHISGISSRARAYIDNEQAKNSLQQVQPIQEIHVQGGPLKVPNEKLGRRVLGTSSLRVKSLFSRRKADVGLGLLLILMHPGW